MVSSSAATRALPSDDCSRRQITNGDVFLPAPVKGKKLADRPRPISTHLRIAVAEMMFETRPGRLSAEFSAVAKSHGMKFEYDQAWQAAGSAAAARTAMKLSIARRRLHNLGCWKHQSWGS
jgi:hypothetical protein